LVKENGDVVGIVDVEEARSTAAEVNLDLVEVSPQSKPPVCKVMDYGKYKFEQKNRHKQKRNITGGSLKEIRCRLKIDDGDFQIKVEKGRKFLLAGHRLQITLTLYGREMTRKELAIDIVNKFSDHLDVVSKIERETKAEGRKVTVLLCPKKK